MLAIAARTGTTRPALVELAEPRELAAGEVLCRTLELGVCGTDREILHSAAPLSPPGDDYLTLGHECLARIEASGEGVSEYRPGDLVVPVVRRAKPADGLAAADQQRVDLLPFGSFTERGIVWEHGFSQPLWIDRPEHLLRVPAEIADLAVLAEPLAVSEKGCNEAAILQQARLARAWRPRVLVTGLGPIAFTAVLAATARGWPVTMLGRDDAATFRARLAPALGADCRALDAWSISASAVEATGFDLLLECTGSDEVMLHAAASVRSCGAIVWLGSSRRPQPALRNVQQLMRDGLLRNHLHVGCVNAAPRDFADALRHLSQLAQTLRSELIQLITARVRPADSLWHYEHRQPQGIKTVLMYD